MDMKDVMGAIQYRNTSEKILNQISDDWRKELHSFVDIIESCKIASFYETELTKKLIMVSNHLHSIKLYLKITDE
jgi:hypothetical protein